MRGVTSRVTLAPERRVEGKYERVLLAITHWFFWEEDGGEGSTELQ
jgi:hypothetical protein